MYMNTASSTFQSQWFFFLVGEMSLRRNAKEEQNTIEKTTRPQKQGGDELGRTEIIDQCGSRLRECKPTGRRDW